MGAVEQEKHVFYIYCNVVSQQRWHGQVCIHKWKSSSGEALANVNMDYVYYTCLQTIGH